MIEILTAGGRPPLAVGNIKKIGAGAKDIAALTTTGNLWVIGTSYFSGTGEDVTNWTKTATDVEDFCCGYRQILIRKKDGSFWYMGQNTHFPTELGSVLTSFVQVTSFLAGPLAGKTIQKMEMSHQSLGILCTDGSVVLSGLNGSGGMGVGNSSQYRTPTLRTDIADIKDIQFDFGTLDTTYILSRDGKILGAGNSNHSQLGISSTSVTSFRVVYSNSSAPPLTIAAGSEGLLIFRRSALNNIGNIAVIGRHFNGSLGTGSATNTDVTLRNVVTVSATDPDPVIMTGTYHARYYVENNGTTFFTGNAGNYIGFGNAYTTASTYAFTQMPKTTFIWDMYAQNRGFTQQSFVLSGGSIYAAGSAGLGLPQTTSTYTLIDTSIVN